MNKQVKQKLCWNCEGSVAIFLENCPYCGVYLSTDQQEQLNFDLLKPPYPLQDENSTNLPEAPYTAEEQNENSIKEKFSSKINFHSFELIVPLLCLSVGTVLAIFSAALYIFAEDGKFTLKWNAEYWYIYAFIAVPALCFGFYTLQNIKEDQKEETSTASEK